MLFERACGQHILWAALANLSVISMAMTPLLLSFGAGGGAELYAAKGSPGSSWIPRFAISEWS
jgi:hypothetical protein